MSGDQPIRRLSAAVERPATGVASDDGRGRMARLLRSLADVAESGDAWTVASYDRDPIHALLLVAFSADGEPTPFVAGDWGENWSRFTNWCDVVRDSADALHALHGWGERDERDPYERTRQRWAAAEHGRQQRAQQRHAEAAERERTHPWLCDCGFRCKSKGGLTVHRRRIHAGAPA